MLQDMALQAAEAWVAESCFGSIAMGGVDISTAMTMAAWLPRKSGRFI